MSQKTENKLLRQITIFLNIVFFACVAWFLYKAVKFVYLKKLPSAEKLNGGSAKIPFKIVEKHASSDRFTEKISPEIVSNGDDKSVRKFIKGDIELIEQQLDAALIAVKSGKCDYAEKSVVRASKEEDDHLIVIHCRNGKKLSISAKKTMKHELARSKNERQPDMRTATAICQETAAEHIKEIGDNIAFSESDFYDKSQPIHKLEYVKFIERRTQKQYFFQAQCDFRLSGFRSIHYLKQHTSSGGDYKEVYKGNEQ